MQNQKRQKILIVFETDALIDPNAVMVKPLDTHTTQAAVFAASRLIQLTCLALDLRLKHQFIILEPLYTFMFILLGYLSWVDCACLVVAVVAHQHQ
jgi:hypothetical protein